MISLGRKSSFRANTRGRIIIIFTLTPVFHACKGWKLPKISVFTYVPADFPFFQITDDFIPCFPRSSSEETNTNLEGSIFTGSSILLHPFQMTKPMYSLLSCKHYLMMFSFNLVPSYSAEILSSGLILHIHLTTLPSFLFSFITSSFLTDQTSLKYGIMLPTHAEYNLLFAPNGKPPLANKDTKPPNLLHPLLILVITLSLAPL